MGVCKAAVRLIRLRLCCGMGCPAGNDKRNRGDHRTGIPFPPREPCNVLCSPLGKR